MTQVQMVNVGGNLEAKNAKKNWHRMSLRIARKGGRIQSGL